MVQTTLNERRLTMRCSAYEGCEQLRVGTSGFLGLGSYPRVAQRQVSHGGRVSGDGSLRLPSAAALRS